VLGVLLFLLLPSAGALRPIAAGDTFFAVYLLLAGFAFGKSAQALRARAAAEDEGMGLVVVIVLAAITISCGSIIAILHHSHGRASSALLLALAGAPLSWFTLHVVAAFHYANLFYSRRSTAKSPLLFPGSDEPAAWDFLYYAFVIGMTAQVSDVQVADTRLRRATLGHGVVSFFFNTVLIAMAVNAVIAIAA